MKSKQSIASLYKELGLKPPKTAAELRAEAIAAAKALPLETRRKFWEAMTIHRKTVGEAREIAGIDDIIVAAELVVLCHEERTTFRPLGLDEIT